MNATPSLPLNVPELIAQLIYALCQTVGMRLRANPPTLTPEQEIYIGRRLLGIRTRLRSLVARIRAGNPPKERVRKPRKRQAKPAEDLLQGFAPPRGWRRWARRDRAARGEPVPFFFPRRAERRQSRTS